MDISVYLCCMDKNKLVKEYEGGKAISALSRDHGVARTTVIRHLKSAGVYENATVDDQNDTGVASEAKSVAQNATVGKKNATVDIYEYAASLPQLEVYDNGSGSKCPVKGNRYYFEELNIWLPVVRDDGPLKAHVDYLPLGKRFRPSHPDHPDNLWKHEGNGDVRHPWMV